MSLPRLCWISAIVAAIGCARHNAPRPTSDVDSVVATVKPARQTITHLIEQPGYVVSYEQTPIYAKIPGFVEEMKVDKGYRVSKGQLLLTMRVPEMEQDLKAKVERVKQADAEIRQASAGLAAADANVNTAEAIVKESDAGVNEANANYRRWEGELERARKLLSTGVFDKQTGDEAKNQFDQAAAGLQKSKAKLNSSQAALNESKAKRDKAAADVEAARARLHVAEAERDQSAAWLDYRNIRAPFDGVVTARNVNTGAFLQSSSSGSTNKAAEPLFVVMRTDKMRVTSQIPEYDAVLVKEGLPALIRFQALPGRDFPAQVTLTTWSFDAQARTLLAECHLLNPKGELRPGMYANVTITAEIPDALTLPSESLMNDGDQTYCFVVEKGKAVRTAVKVGVHTNKVTQVVKKQGEPKSPGAEGEWEDFTGQEVIVARNPASLIDGQAVTPAGPERP